MAHITTSTKSQMEAAIQAAVKHEIHRIIEEEIESAQNNVDRRVREIADTLALRLLSAYSVQEHGHRIIIDVNKRVVA